MLPANEGAAFSEAVGKDVCRPYYPDLMQQAFAGIEPGSARLRECSFLFFGVMARVYGDEFASWLPKVVPILITSCKLEEGGKKLTRRKSCTTFGHARMTNPIIASNAEALAAFPVSGSGTANAIAVIDKNDPV